MGLPHGGAVTTTMPIKKMKGPAGDIQLEKKIKRKLNDAKEKRVGGGPSEWFLENAKYRGEIRRRHEWLRVY